MYNIEQLNAMDAAVIAGCSERHRQSVIEDLIETAKATLASAAQESAPAELPPIAIKTWQERLREKFPETADRNLFAVGHLEHAMEAEIAELRAALSRPVVAQDKNARLRWALRELISTLPANRDWLNPDAETALREIFVSLAAAPASPQPVQRHIYDWLHLVETKIGTPTAAFAARVLKAFYEGVEPDTQPVAKVLSGIQRWHLTGEYLCDPTDLIRADDGELVYLKDVLNAFAASTPTTLTEKK